jgi:hypothetical protein
MNPQIMLVFSLGVLSCLAIILFGAPFLPPLRPLAYPILLVLASLGTAFIALIVIILLLIIILENGDKNVNDDYKKKTTSNNFDKDLKETNILLKRKKKEK